MTSIKVELSQVEAFLASQVGSFRNTKSLAQGNPDAFGLSADKDGWGLHIEGAAGEMAAAGHAFFRSENGVWLTDTVPVGFIDFGGE